LEVNILDEPGAQRHSLASLKAWERVGYGMFIHFGMSTFDGDEFSNGKAPSSLYAPTHLDVDQWLQTASDAGMRYAVLTAKHTAGHCLWPSGHTDYHVGNSGNTTDVVEAFVAACLKYHIKPGLYYCSWDNHHRFGSFTPSDLQPVSGDLMGPLTDNDAMTHRNPDRASVIRQSAYTTEQYREFQWRQIEELCTRYGSLFEFWLDIPGVLPRDYRNKLYAQIKQWQPECIFMANSGISDGSSYEVNYAWPSDLIAIERFLPNSSTGHQPWRCIEGKDYYMPAEVCDPIGKQWFYQDGDPPRSDAELLGMFLTCRSRNTNLLLNVPPDRTGVIPRQYVEALIRLRNNLESLNLLNELLPSI
jgi:alpha-L-fucosidase